MPPPEEEEEVGEAVAQLRGMKKKMEGRCSDLQVGVKGFFYPSVHRSIEGDDFLGLLNVIPYVRSFPAKFDIKEGQELFCPFLKGAPISAEKRRKTPPVCTSLRATQFPNLGCKKWV